MRLTKDEVERFISHVHRSRDDSACWPWKGGRVKGPGRQAGYGRFWLRGKTRRAHRVAWLIWRGPIPDGVDVLHTCDNPPCVRPGHLFLGTDADNARDAFTKGRRTSPVGRARGEGHGRARLNEIDVLGIRERWSSGERQEDIGRDYGITQSRVSEIVNRRTWRHI